MVRLLPLQWAAGSLVRRGGDGLSGHPTGVVPEFQDRSLPMNGRAIEA
jgi:hypothetical protein